MKFVPEYTRLWYLELQIMGISILFSLEKGQAVLN